MRIIVASLIILAPAASLFGREISALKGEWDTLLQPKAVIAEVPVPEGEAPAIDEQPEAIVLETEVQETEGIPVETPPVFVTANDILTTLRDELILKFDLEGELEIMPNSPLTKIQVPNINWHVELVAPLPANLSARMHLRYRLTDGFQNQPDRSIAVHAEWWRDAYVSNRILRPGDINAKKAYQVERINWLHHRGALVPTDTDLSGLRLKSTWRADEPLLWTSVESRPVIEEGEVVEVIAREGALRITMRGVALENGRVGELISVRNLQSRKEIQGIISHENTVLVVF